MPPNRNDAGARDWLALQIAAALRPRETTPLLRGGARPREVLDGLALAVPSARRVRRAEGALAALRAVLLPFGAPGYPAKLAALEDAPAVLALRGDPGVLAAPAVGIVGSRAASAYGLHVARRVAEDLGAAGVAIVSGLAFGVDAAAHAGALAGGGRTIAVQACGLDRVYPAAHRPLAERIAGCGAVLTEFPIGMAPRPGFFPLRNRLISALSDAVVVVEARERSGSLVTARHAADQGVDVFAVPGPIDVPHHVGSNRLLRDGAAPLLESADVLASLAWPSTRRAATGPALSEDARAVLEALRHEAASVDALARRLGRTSASLATPLLELELQARAKRDRDGRWRALG